MKKTFSNSILILTIALLGLPSFVLAVTSTNYQLEMENNFSGSHHQVSGAAYNIEGDVGPFGGALSGTSYSVESGAGASWYCGDGFVDPDEDCDKGNYGTNLNGGTCSSEGFSSGTLACSSTCSYNTSSCTNSSGGGGGGGSSGRDSDPDPNTEEEEEPTINTSTLAQESESAALARVLAGVGQSGRIAAFSGDFGNDTIDYLAKTTDYNYYTFDPFVFFYGPRLSEKITVKVNNIQGALTNKYTWGQSIELAYGYNVIQLVANDSYVDQPPGEIIAVRRPPGDATGDLAINDYDVSVLINHWGETPSLKTVDFNFDGETDEYDLSILLAYWKFILPPGSLSSVN